MFGVWFLLSAVVIIAIANATTGKKVEAKVAPKRHTKGNTNPLYYYPVHEGLSAQIRHLELVWNLATGVNRRVIAIPFQSHHYMNVSVALCDVFDLPRDISCNVREPIVRNLVEQNKCAVMGPEGSSCRVPQAFHHHKCTSNFDWAQVSCVAGMAGYEGKDGSHHTYGRPGLPDRPYKRLMTAKSIKPYYIHLYVSVVQEFGVPQTNKLVVIHWRRYDQSLRCGNKIKGQHDKSVNCQGPQEFHNQIITDMKTLSLDLAHYMSYIATNEMSKDNLATLERLGHNTSLDASILKHRNPFESFMVELVMLCRADVVLLYGVSAIHGFVLECRSHDKSKFRNTLLDGKRLSMVATSPMKPKTPAATSVSSNDTSPSINIGSSSRSSNDSSSSVSPADKGAMKPKTPAATAAGNGSASSNDTSPSISI